MSDRYSHPQHQIVSFMTQILGKSISIFYSEFGNDISWYGIFLYLINLLIAITTLRIGFMTGKSIDLYLSIIFLIIVTPFNILTPTYTVTSALAGGIGILGLVISVKYSKKITDIVFLITLILMSFLIRPEAMLGTVLFVGPVSLFFLISNWKYLIKNKLILILTTTLGLVGIINYFQKLILNNLSKVDTKNYEYLNFQSIRHEIFYTPSLLKLHQGVISGDILKGIWSNIDFIILRNWAYADSNVFSYLNILNGRNQVSKYIGFEGLLNTDYSQVFEVIFASLREVVPILIIIFSALICIFLRTYKKLSNYLLLLVASLFYGFGFFYTAAVLRLPFRVTFPYLCLIIIVFILLQKEAKVSQSKVFVSKIILIFIFIQVCLLQFNSYIGIFGISSSNSKRIEFATLRDKELTNFLSTAIFIGPLAYFPINTQGSYFSNINWNSGNSTVALDWSTFSPTWRAQIAELNLDTNNLYKSLAKQENVYWVSDSYLAEILDMYMNDRKIYRGKLCSVAKLSGPDQAEIFTYQAKEDDC